MTPAPQTSGELAELESHLRAGLDAEFKHESRAYTFDMFDSAEDAILNRGRLRHALNTTRDLIQKKWQTADQAAQTSQSRHRFLARISILAGAAAIILAALQLALTEQAHYVVGDTADWQGKAGVLEIISIAAGAMAVSLGLFAKFNRQWLGQRYQAERLRMLKFQALIRPELVCGQDDLWETWIKDQLARLQGIVEFQQVKEWAEQEHDEAPATALANGKPDQDFLATLVVFYRVKRLEFQKRYFAHRADQFQNQFRLWNRLAIPLFFVPVLFALSHFAAESHAKQLLAHGLEATARSWEIAALWFVVAGVVIPVACFAVRAWFAAFEVHRNAALYEAKQKALEKDIRQLPDSSATTLEVLQSLTKIERKLEGEHAEWLRLLMDAEWFL